MVTVLKRLVFWIAAVALFVGVIAFALATVTAGYAGASATTEVEYTLSRFLVPGAFVGFLAWLMLVALHEADVHAHERRASIGA